VFWFRATTSGPCSRLLCCYTLLFETFGLPKVGSPPWREDRSVIQLHNSGSVSGRSPSGLVTTIYCLLWNSHNLENQVPAFIAPRKGWRSNNPHVVEGQNTSTVSLWDVRGDRKGTSARGYDWGTGFEDYEDYEEKWVLVRYTTGGGGRIYHRFWRFPDIARLSFW
jgi:hypothetical protein